ncbi:hypothetical protein BLNAU_23326 [Blattamonas nauphoetae]|uniref:Uncharacterized protein n=1 Tax=Blattamonas nauphoetae TaxID=2049346 RepID=A0ABQ9WR31_9EUKA|nr:hypothetical protein BLNAU_23326 [Blattamonas nauphoetae]
MALSSCLSFIDNDDDLWTTLIYINLSLEEWNEEDPVVKSGKQIIQTLFSEGFEDTLEQKLLNDKNGLYGFRLVDYCRSVFEIFGDRMCRGDDRSISNDPSNPPLSIDSNSISLSGLSSDVGNALIAGADEQIPGSPPFVQKWVALLGSPSLQRRLSLPVTSSTVLSKPVPSVPERCNLTRLSFTFSTFDHLKTLLVYLVEIGCAPHSHYSTAIHISFFALLAH